jgi:hypothetical protein
MMQANPACASASWGRRFVSQRDWEVRIEDDLEPLGRILRVLLEQEP